MKKFLAVFLSILVCFSVFALPAGAAFEDKVTVSDSKAEQIAEEYFATLVGASDDAEVEISSSLAQALTENGTSAVKLADTLSDIVLVKVSDIDEKTMALLDATDTKVNILENGKAELYIAINLEENPEIYNIVTFGKYVNAVIDNSDAYFAQHGYDPATTETELVYDNYTRFAGELALHMVLYRTLSPLQKVVSSSVIDDLVNRAVYAEITTSESRVPVWFMVMVGFVVMTIATLFK